MSSTKYEPRYVDLNRLSFNPELIASAKQHRFATRFFEFRLKQQQPILEAYEKAHEAKRKQLNKEKKQKRKEMKLKNKEVYKNMPLTTTQLIHLRRTRLKRQLALSDYWFASFTAY